MQEVGKIPEAMDAVEGTSMRIFLRRVEMM